jgi:hypothetical protein
MADAMPGDDAEGAAEQEDQPVATEGVTLTGGSAGVAVEEPGEGDEPEAEDE